MEDAREKHSWCPVNWAAASRSKHLWSTAQQEPVNQMMSIVFETLGVWGSNLTTVHKQNVGMMLDDTAAGSVNSQSNTALTW